MVCVRSEVLQTRPNQPRRAAPGFARNRHFRSSPLRDFLDVREISAFVERVASGCNVPFIVKADDNYATVASVPNAPVYRSVCGSVWFHIDGASGAILEQLDPSRRAYRWFYSALHTMDFPILSARPTLRSALVVILCGFGFAFSLTGVVIGWHRLRRQFSAPGTQARAVPRSRVPGQRKGAGP